MPGLFQNLTYDSSKNKLYTTLYDESNNKTKLFVVDCQTKKASELKNIIIQGQIFNIGQNKMLFVDGRLFLRSQIDD